LESLYQIDYPDYDVILVDNHSTDDSLEKIRKYCQGRLRVESDFFEYQQHNKPINILEYTQHESELAMEKKWDDIPVNRRIILIKNDKNYGFAEGNNVAIRFALKNLYPDYNLLLNNDTVVDHRFLSLLVEAGESQGDIGLIGPKIFFYDFYGKKDVIWTLGGPVDFSSYPGYHELEDIPKTRLIDVDWISGAALMIKSRNTPQNTLNSEYLFGCEDVDLALKLKNAGFKVVTDTNAVIWHKVSASKKKLKFRGIYSEIKTNLKFLKAHNPHYYWYLPLYLLQIIWRFISLILHRIYRDLKN
jgi:GT2 family glycosyltransferase